MGGLISNVQLIKLGYQDNFGKKHFFSSHCRDYSGYRLSQWEAMLHCNIASHWLIAYPLLWHPSGSCEHIEVWIKWLTFCRQNFQMYLIPWKFLNCIQNFTGVCSWGFNWHYVSTGSGDGLAPNRWQAIIWHTDDQFPWSHWILKS